MGRRRNTYRCGGYSSHSGHCGATDCETCHPGGAREMALAEATAELRGALDEVEGAIAETDDEGAVAALTARADGLRSEIADVERGFDDDGPDEPYDDGYDLRDAGWEG